MVSLAAPRRGYLALLQEMGGTMVQRLPNFFVIGAPRSGTTSFYEYLKAHPDIFMSPVKEPDFFIRSSLDAALISIGAELPTSLSGAARSAPDLQHDLHEYLALFSGAGDQSRRGEASAAYLAHPTAASHLHRYLPDARLIAVLREPTERAYSHYIHAMRLYAEHGRTDVVGAPGRSLDEEFARAVDVAYRHGIPDRAATDPEVWLRSGLYHENLTRLYSYFPPAQVQVFLFDDLVRDPAAVMRSTFEFLEVDEEFSLPTTEAFNASVVPHNRRVFALFTTRNPVMRYAKSLAPARARAMAMHLRNHTLAAKKPPMEPDIRRKLNVLYREDVRCLQELIGRDLSAWRTAAS